jgi:hypothetical protein
MNPIRVGTYVTHSQRPAWGVGKVFGQSTQHVLVGFSALPEVERFKRLEWRIGLLEKATVTSDPELDSWKVECDSTCHYLGAVAKVRKSSVKPAQYTKEDAMERFLHKYNGDFPDAWYRSSYRSDRVAQHELWKKGVPVAKLRKWATSDPLAGGKALLEVLETSSKPLLHAKNDLPRLREALTQEEHLGPFLTALADMVEAETPTAPLFNAYLAAFAALETNAKKTPMTWSIVTAILFIANPTIHMHLRPTPIKKSAAGLGFELKFQPKPNWVSYERLLAFSNDLLAFIKPRSGRDMIDVSAFISATAE